MKNIWSNLVKFGQSDQMPVNLQISEFIAGRQLPMSPLPYTNMAESKPTFRPYINLLKLQIHNINKMNYLKCMITGDSACTILGLPIMSQNYNTAIRMLQERFGRKQVLINAHMESLEVQQLRKSYDNCERGSANRLLWKLVNSHTSQKTVKRLTMHNFQG